MSRDVGSIHPKKSSNPMEACFKDILLEWKVIRLPSITHSFD